MLEEESGEDKDDNQAAIVIEEPEDKDAAHAASASKSALAYPFYVKVT